MGLELIPSSDYIYCPTLYSCAYIGIEEVLFAQRLGKAERIPNRTSEVQLGCQVYLLFSTVNEELKLITVIACSHYCFASSSLDFARYL